MVSPLAVASVQLGMDDNELIRELNADFPNEELCGIASSAVDWIAARLAAHPKLPAGFAAVQRLTTGTSRPHVVHVTGMALMGVLPPTPTVDTSPRQAIIGSFDIGHIALACCIGQIYGSSQLRQGCLVQDISLAAQADSTSMTLNGRHGLGFHVDGSSDLANAPTYFTLQCLRNAERVATSANTVTAEQFSPDVWARLGQRAYETLHPSQRPQEIALVERNVWGNVTRLNYHDDPARLRVSSSIPQQMRTLYKDALGQLRQALAHGAIELVLQPTDVLVMDNYRAVHGRRPFDGIPLSPGRSHWLRRCWVTQDGQQIYRLRRVRDRVLRSAVTG